MIYFVITHPTVLLHLYKQEDGQMNTCGGIKNLGFVYARGLPTSRHEYVHALKIERQQDAGQHFRSSTLKKHFFVNFTKPLSFIQILNNVQHINTFFSQLNT
jgi:hypothetical protein